MKSNVKIYSCHANINNVWCSDRYSNTDWQFEMFKIGKDNGHGTGFKCKLKTGFLIFSNICCWYTMPLCGNSNVYLQYVSFK